MKLPNSTSLVRCLCVFLLSTLLFLVHTQPSSALTVATWNAAANSGLLPGLNISGFGSSVNPDILLLTEVRTQPDMDRFNSSLGGGYETALSDFGGNLEVGILSRAPLTNVVEFEQVPRGANAQQLVTPSFLSGNSSRVGRGFLFAEIPSLQLYVIVTHLKSSRGSTGRSDILNAEKRELVAGAIAEEIKALRAANPGYTVIYGGDVNVGVSDADKNGTNLAIDTISGPGDRYDETHFLLDGGASGFGANSLSANVPSTFRPDGDNPFPRSGAIDVLYAEGPDEDDFNAAQATSSNFGSDHLAVFSEAPTITISPTPVIPPTPNPVTTPITQPLRSSLEIVNALPNPNGTDDGNEQVVLRLASGRADISGWFLKDEADNVHTFPSGTTLNSGDNTLTLTAHTMPLNNGGDIISLFDTRGNQVGPSFAYSGSEVVPGEFVR